jgi:hypothetical protein
MSESLARFIADKTRRFIADVAFLLAKLVEARFLWLE